MPMRHYYPLNDYFPEAEFIDCDPHSPFQGFCHDTRSIKKDELFLVFDGQNAHGCEFIEQALSKGALGVVISKTDYEQYQPQCPAVVVASVLGACRKAVSKHRELFPGRIYAVTGTAGKTSTKEYFAQIIQQLCPDMSFFVSYGNWNNTLGLMVNLSRLPLQPVLNLFELGINGPGDMDELVDILRPNGAVITAIGEAHLEKLHNCEGVAAEKQKIIKYADKAWTTPQALRYFDQKKIHWNTIEDLQAVSTIALSHNLIQTTIQCAAIELTVYSSGIFHPQNFILALQVLLEQHPSLELNGSHQIIIQTPKGRGNLELWGDFYILDDTYNASIPALKHLLDFLSRLSDQIKVGVILSDLGELGESEQQLLDEVFAMYPPKDQKIYYYYTGKDPKAWSERGAFVFPKNYEGVHSCFAHAQQHGLTMMAFKASRKTALEDQMLLFIECLKHQHRSLGRCSLETTTQTRHNEINN